MPHNHIHAAVSTAGPSDIKPFARLWIDGSEVFGLKALEVTVRRDGPLKTAELKITVLMHGDFLTEEYAEDLIACQPPAGRWDEAVIEAMCRAHDEEEAAQKGEPSPWRQDLVDQYIAENGEAAHAEWVAERVAAMRCALKAVGLA